jgi:Lrp/AsnC family transcriptional regulator, leucine-responsive regulatory protein
MVNNSIYKTMASAIPSMELDELDLRILTILQVDAALSNVELAQRVHASEATCLRRVRALVEQGVIEKRVAIVSPQALGNRLTAIVEVTLNEQHAERLDAFEALLVKESTISQCYRVSPGPDFVLIIIVSDMPSYHALAQRLFTAQHHVRQVRVYFSIKRGKFETGVPMALPQARI